MIQYKIIKNIYEFRKGDILEESKSLKDTYELRKEYETETSIMSMTVNIDKEYADTLVNDGYAIRLAYDNGSSCECSQDCWGTCSRLAIKINEIESFVDSLIEQYTKDHDSLITSFKEGYVQPCVKTEADTVYYNMQKLLKAIKNKINE